MQQAFYRYLRFANQVIKTKFKRVMKVGFIGLGAMGSAFATLIMRAGNEMVVYDINPKAVEAMAKNGARGDIFTDFSTGSPTSTRKIAKALKEKGVDMLDSPVSGGGPNVAWAKGEMALVGGGKEVLERAKPVIEAMSKGISYCGLVGNGMVVKLINNYSCFVIFDLFFEAMSIAAKEGLDLAGGSELRLKDGDKISLLPFVAGG